MAETRQLPVNEREIELLKSVFKNNDELLKMIRALFFGFDLTSEEKTIIKNTFKNKELREALRKKIFPLISNEPPIGQLADFWLGVEGQIFGASENTIYQAVQSKNKVKKMLIQAFSLLDDVDGERVDINYDPDTNFSDPLQVNLLARNLYIKSVEMGLNWLNVAVNKEEEKPQERKKRLALDSNE